MSWRRTIPRRKNGYVPRPRMEQIYDSDSEDNFDIEVVHKLFEEPESLRLSISATLARMKEREEQLSKNGLQANNVHILKKFELIPGKSDESDNEDSDTDDDVCVSQESATTRTRDEITPEIDLHPDLGIIDDDISNDEFDFETSDDSMDQPRRRVYDTREIYLKSCRANKVQPSQTFLNQINRERISLRSLMLKPRDIKPIAIALVRDSMTTVLDLSYNDLGPTGIMFVAEMIQENNTLLDIELSATFPDREGLLSLAEALNSNRNICTFNLSHNRIPHTDADIIAKIIMSVRGLEELYLGHNSLGFEGGKIIADAVAASTSLLNLDLEWNAFRRASAIELANMLSKNKHLKILNVAWNGFGKEGCIALGKSLANNNTLHELNLTSNRVDPSSLSYLLQGLVKNTTLSCIKLGSNSLTTEGCKALVATIGTCKTTNIQTIGLEDIPVDTEFVQMVKILTLEKNMVITHGREMKIGTVVDPRKHDSSDLSKYDPLLILFEYMRLDNLRLIDLFKMFDTKKRDKLSKANLREGLTVLQIPLTEHALDVLMKGLDTKKDRLVDLEEFMNGQRETSRFIIQRTLKAKKKKKEDEGLKELRKILKEIIKKRKDMQSDKERAKKKEMRDKQEQKKRISMITAGEKKSVAGLFRETVLRVMREAKLDKEKQKDLIHPEVS